MIACRVSSSAFSSLVALAIASVPSLTCASRPGASFFSFLASWTCRGLVLKVLATSSRVSPESVCGSGNFAGTDFLYSSDFLSPPLSRCLPLASAVSFSIISSDSTDNAAHWLLVRLPAVLLVRVGLGVGFGVLIEVILGCHWYSNYQQLGCAY
jgi:hypothetical protein